jgi:uncharacterized membrane protein YecN with MAPEG domain
MPILPFTAILAGAAAIGLVLLSFPIANHRRAARISAGDAGDDRFNRMIRAQANFTEYVPVGLIVLGLLEAASPAGWQLWAVGGTLAVGRFLHPIGLIWNIFIARALGAILTFAALLLGGGLLLWATLGA